MIWARMLAYSTVTVDQELLLRNECLAAENRILRANIKGRLLLSDSERTTLAEIARRLGRKALQDVASAAKPDTLLRWYRNSLLRNLIDRGFANRGAVPGLTKKSKVWSFASPKRIRPGVTSESWVLWRISGYKVSDQAVGNILKRHDIPPAPKRKRAISWQDFILAHMAVMVGTDFFTVEVLTLEGLKTYYLLFFLHLESRRVCLAGVTRHPDQEWMEQMARNVTMEGRGF